MDEKKLFINFEDSEPIYNQIVNAIKKKIIDDEWKPGMKIPSEETLCVELGVSRGTIRKAISILVDEGALEKKQGKGTFISKEKISYPFAQELSSYAESMQKKGLEFDTLVLKQQVIMPSKEIQRKLQIGSDSKVLYLERLRSLEGEAAILLYNWVALERCPNIEDVDYEKTSLFEAIENSLKTKLKYGIRNFSANNLDKNQANLLSLKKNDPILCIDQTTYNNVDNPIECSYVLLRTDKYKVTSVLYR